MSGIYKSLKWPDGQSNPSGIKTRVFIAPKSFIKTHPRVISAPVTEAEFVTLAGDYEMNTGKTFLELYTTQGKGKVEFETVGEKDHQMFTNKGTFKFPDISNAAKALAKSYLNSNAVVVALLPHETEFRAVVIGEDDFDVTVKFKGTSGDAAGSEKGLTFDIECSSYNPLPSYAGAIVLEDGTYDCETGVFTPTP